MAVPLQLSIPEKIKKGASIPFQISNASGVDTIEIEGPDGETKKILGDYLTNNDFKDTIKGTLENVKASQFTAVGYGSHYVGNPSNPSSMRQMFDKKLLESVSNKAQMVLPSSMTNENNSSSTDSGKTGKIVKYAIGAVGLGGVLYYVATQMGGEE